MNKSERLLFYVTFVVVVAISFLGNFGSDIIFQGLIIYNSEQGIIYNSQTWLIIGFLIYVITILIAFFIYRDAIKRIR
jgi:hypothetical protein